MKWLKRIAIGLLAFLAVVVLWGFTVGPRWINVEEEVAPLPNLPPSWEGQRIAAIADFQIGMWGANTGTIRRIVDRIVEERPAAVLIAGDFVYKADDRLDEILPEVARLVRPLTAAGIPTFAVLGNHDYSIDVRADPKNARVARGVETTLERSGVRVLHNEAVPLSANADGPAEPLYLVGIGAAWAYEDQPAEAVAQVPSGAARLVFMHNPHSFLKLPPRTAPVAVAAHTHGGQIALPFTPDWSWMALVKDVPVVGDGWSRDDFSQPGNYLYVNVGIGFSDVPMRVNASPEVTFFTLRRAVPDPQR